jgi:hypothetical protein
MEQTHGVGPHVRAAKAINEQPAATNPSVKYDRGNDIFEHVIHAALGEL